MNHYKPREITKEGKPTGLFHYTCRNDNQIWPVGPCADGCPGHATTDEAREHYRQWLIDGITFYAETQEWPKEKCESEGCNQQATFWGVSRNEPGQFNQRRFCKDHATKEEMAKFIDAGDCSSSY